MHCTASCGSIVLQPISHDVYVHGCITLCCVSLTMQAGALLSSTGQLWVHGQEELLLDAESAMSAQRMLVSLFQSVKVSQRQPRVLLRQLSSVKGRQVGVNASQHLHRALESQKLSWSMSINAHSGCWFLCSSQSKQVNALNRGTALFALCQWPGWWSFACRHLVAAQCHAF